MIYVAEIIRCLINANFILLPLNYVNEKMTNDNRLASIYTLIIIHSNPLRI